MSESVTTDATIIGQVKWFNVKAGYGFITVVSPTSEHKGKDIFVHYSALSVENSLYRYLVQGEYVEFKLVKPVNDKYELHASGVSGLFGGSIMCENRVREDQARSQRIRPDVPPRREQQPRITAASSAVVAPEDDGFQQVQRRKSSKA
jgi:cold shock CspA family protein